MALPPELDFKDRDPITKGKLDKAFEYIMAKFRTLDNHVPDWAKAVDELRVVGLQRINEAIMPAYQRVMALAKFGFLLANSKTRLTLTVGDRRIFTIDDENQRGLFTPTAFVTITRVSNSADWAIARVERYDADTGLLAVVVEAAHISADIHDDWQITASAGSVSAAIALLADTRAARDAASAIKGDTAAIKALAINDIRELRDAADVARVAAEKAARDAGAAALLIEGGPVASVAGKTGNVRLTLNDVEELPVNLALRLSIATKQTLTGAQKLFGLENLGIFDGMLVPTGVVTHFYGTKAPKGWLKINGVLLLRNDFPELFAFAQNSGGIVTEAEWQAGARGRFSSGDGSTSFRLPDARGEFFRAWSDGAGVDANRAFGCHQDDEFRSHGHSGSTGLAGDHSHSAWTDAQGSHTHWVSGQREGGAAGAPVTPTYQGNVMIWVGGQNTSAGGSHAHNVGLSTAGGHSHDLAINAAGGEETRPRNIALLAIIKY